MRSALSIELSENYLKMVAVRPENTSVQTTAMDFIIEPIAHLTDDKITRVIASSFQRLKFKPKSTVLCLPRNQVTVKNIHLPSQDKTEIEKMIDLHIVRLVPFKKEEILFGHQFLGANITGYADEIVAIAHRDTVKRQHRMIEAAGISLDNIILSSYGTWQWAVSNFRQEINKKDLYLLLDMDYAFTDLIIFGADKLVFSRGISLEVGLGRLDEAAVAKLVNEVKQSLIIFYNEALNKKPMGIYLSGSAAVKDIHSRLEKEFDIPIKYVPTPDSKYAKKSPKTNIPSNISMSAVSELILEENPNRISFLLPEMQIRKSLKEKTRELLILGSLLVYLFSCSLAILLGRLHVQHSYLKQLSEQNAAIREDVGVMLDHAKKVEFVKEFAYRRQAPLAFLNTLQKIIPPKIAMNYVGIDEENKITLRGHGSQLSDVFEFVTMLEKSERFKGVATKYTRTKKVKEKEITDFELNFNLVF